MTRWIWYLRRARWSPIDRLAALFVAIVAGLGFVVAAGVYLLTR